MTRITALLSLLFLFFAFTTKLKGAIAGTVLDTDGSPVQNGGDYYILPCNSEEEEGGGITLASIAVRHPLAVVQSASKNSLGLPVTISDGTMVIQTDNMVTIKFTNLPNYDNSSTWVVVMDEFAKVWYVGIGSAEDCPSDQIKMGSFQIKDYNKGYKFGVCSGTNTSDCEDVGIFKDGDGNNRLALFDNGGADAFKFKNADKAIVALAYE